MDNITVAKNRNRMEYVLPKTRLFFCVDLSLFMMCFPYLATKRCYLNYYYITFSNIFNIWGQKCREKVHFRSLLRKCRLAFMSRRNEVRMAPRKTKKHCYRSAFPFFWLVLTKKMPHRKRGKSLCYKNSRTFFNNFSIYFPVAIPTLVTLRQIQSFYEKDVN